jgi:hypothetical protein
LAFGIRNIWGVCSAVEPSQVAVPLCHIARCSRRCRDVATFFRGSLAQPSMRDVFEQAERAFLNTRAGAERDFAVSLDQARANAPEEAQAELAETERVFRAAADHALCDFYDSLEWAW